MSISGGILILKGKKHAGHKEKEEDYHLIERQYGSFRRRVPLGFTPEEGDVDADFKAGVLNLRIWKPANANQSLQKIDIKKS